MHLEAVADELYRLPPGEFTAARNEAAKKARSHGDRQLAQQIRSLRRPTTPAWLANQLVHHHPAEMEALLDLGRELREVMAELGAEELRELTQQRYRLVSALVDQARSIASRQVGARVTDEVAQALRTTLEATLSDPGSAEAVASGHLAEALSVSGFGSMAHRKPPPSVRRRGRVAKAPSVTWTNGAGAMPDGEPSMTSRLPRRTNAPLEPRRLPPNGSCARPRSGARRRSPPSTCCRASSRRRWARWTNGVRLSRPRTTSWRRPAGVGGGDREPRHGSPASPGARRAGLTPRTST